MAYNWTNRDIGAVHRILRECGGNKAKAAAEILKIVPSLPIEEVEIALEITEHENRFDRGRMSFEALRESQARLGLTDRTAKRFDYYY